MKSGLDLSKFKKTGSDKDCTTLRHKDGHEIKIAHHKLSAKMRGELESLRSDEPQKMSGGGPVQGPCMNENCKSYGHVHPNCKCYGGFAKGGMAKSYCAEGKPHMDGCQYFAGGGQAMMSSGDEQAPNDQAQADDLSKKGVNITVNAAPQPSPSQEDAYKGHYADNTVPIGPAPPQAAVAPPMNNTPMPGIGTAMPPKDNSPVPGIGQAMAPDEQAALAAQTQPPQAAEQAPTAPAGNTVAPKEEESELEAPKDKLAQTMLEQADLYKQDLYNGHISPKTYGDLFYHTTDKDGKTADRGTLSKIGTLFGLLAGGIGSGLTHQPSAFVEMMNKEIDNDLKAQSQSKTNALNFYNANIQRVMNEAHARNLDTNNEMTKKQIETIGLANAKIQMLQTGVKHLEDQIKTMPEGPAKEDKKKALAYIFQQSGDQIMDISHRAAAAVEFSRMLNDVPGAKGGPQSTEDEFKNKVMNMETLGGPMGAQRAKQLTARHFSGVPEAEGQTATRDIEPKDHDRMEAMNLLSNKGREILAFARAHKGSVNPSVLREGAQKAEELKSYYNNSLDKLGMTQGRMAWLDKQISEHPTSLFQEILGNNRALEEIVNSNDTRRKTLLKSYGITPKASGSSDMVQVISPKGQKGSMPKASLKEALKRGFKEAK